MTGRAGELAEFEPWGRAAVAPAARPGNPIRTTGREPKLTVSKSPAHIIRRALDEAAAVRRDYADATDRALIAEYESVAFALDRRTLAVITARQASGVGPDGTLTLAAADLMTVLGALADGTDYRAARGDSAAVAAYRAVARALGDDR